MSARGESDAGAAAMKATVWNPVTGCSVVSPGCENCDAMRLAGRAGAQPAARAGLTRPGKTGPVWNGALRLNRESVNDPLVTWRKPRWIVVNAHGDLFHETIPHKWIDLVFSVMAMARRHWFYVCTKRPERMHRYLAEPRVRRTVAEGPPLLIERMENIIDARWEVRRTTWPWAHEESERWPLRNLCLAVSVEDRERLTRLDWLRGTEAAARALVLEPLLEDPGVLNLDGLHWVVLGGETGPQARPMHPDWVRSVRDQCLEAGVPFYFRQWGNWGGPWAPGPGRSGRRNAWKLETLNHKPLPGNAGLYMMRVGKKRAGRELDGRTHDDLPTVWGPAQAGRAAP